VRMISNKKNNLEFIGELDINNHKIMSMESEKRDRIIQSAMQEFCKGYRAANTDEITKNAGISKGLLFHYFGSKKGLFLFLMKYAAETVRSEYIKVIIDSRDFLENLRKVSLLAMDLTFKYKLIYEFMVKGFFSLNEVFPEGLPKDIHNPTQQMMLQIYQNTDTSLFRDDIDIEKSRNIIIWTMKGFTDKLLVYGNEVENYKAHYDEIMKELDEYLQILRKILYR
jgi:TetR/AcrR family transcriptional regulator